MPTSITLNEAAPALGQQATFTIAVPSKYDCTGHAGCARVEVRAYQDGNLVYGEATDIESARGNDRPLVLGGAIGAGSIWAQQGGPADCVANLFRFGKEQGQQVYELLATTSFAAGG